MKQVLEQYGSAVVAVILGALIYMVLLQGDILHGKSFPDLLGEVLSYSVETEHVRSDAFAQYMHSGAPQILRREDVWICCNECMKLTDLFEAKSAHGEPLPIYLQQAWRISGEPVDLFASEDGTSICIEEAGVYWVQLYTVDANRKETSVISKLLVNER